MYDITGTQTSELDVTNEKTLGKALQERINEIVADSQAFILTPLPGRLLLTRTQFESLISAEALQEMVEYNQFTEEIKPIKDALFITPHNVMEVVVKDDEQWQNTEMLKHLNMKK